MSVRSDVINLFVNVKGDSAQNELNDLRKAASNANAELSKLKKGTQEYADKKKELDGINAKITELKQNIGLTSLTQKELIAELNKLKALRGSVVPFTEEYKELSKQIKQVENRLYDVKNGVQGFSSFLSKIKDEVKQFGMLAAGYLGFEFLTNQFTNIIQGAGKLSDQLADIRRVTGMTDLEVQSLNKSLTNLNTRTSTSGLREIAIIAGKLGVAKNDILGFVEATDKLVVALGDELGSADQITTQLGKIIGVFDKGDGKVTGEKLTFIGNAIVDLANKGVASGGFIVDFTQRLAGLAKTANVSLDEVMGLAAGLEESGQKAESSSTAIIKVLGDIGKDVPKFAKIAGKSVEEFSETLKNKPIEALIQVSQGLAQGKKSFAEITQAFSTAGEDGARVVTTLGVIGGKADWFRQKIADTGTALQKTDQINDAFILKNLTLGATLDILGKEFNQLITSEGVTNFLKGAVEGTLNFIKWLKNLPQWFAENRTAIAATTTIILMYVAAKTKATQAIWLNRVATLLETAVDKLSAAQKIASTVVTRAYATAKGILTGQITLATAASATFNLVLKQNPIVWVIGLIGGLITAYSYLSSKLGEVVRSQRIQQELQAKITELTGEEEIKAKSLFSAIKDTNTSYDTKKELLKKLIELNPQYLKGLTLENINTEAGSKILENYIINLRKASEEKARQALIDEKTKKKLELQSKMDKAQANIGEDYSVSGVAKNLLSSVGIGEGTNLNQFVDLSKQISEVDKDLEELFKKSAESTVKAVAEKGQKVAESTQSSVRTIKVIKDEIEALDKTFVEIDVTNKAGLKQNRDQRAKLQAELDALEGKKSRSEKKGESELEKLKKEAKQFEEELRKFRTDVEKYGRTADEKELIDLQEKYAKLTAQSLKYFKAHVTDLKTHNRQNITIEQLYNQELEKILAQRFEKNAAKEYEDSLVLDANFREQQKTSAAKQYTDGILNKEQYENKLKQIELDGANNRVLIAKDYAANVKKAKEDLVQFEKQAEQQTTNNLIAEYEERLAEAKLKTITSKGDRKLQAQKDLLQLEFDLKTQYWDKESQQYKLAVAERLESEKDLEKKYRAEKIDQLMQYVNYFQEALSSINTIISNGENRQLQRDQQANELKKKRFKSQLDSKLISQSIYDKKVQQSDEELDNKKKQIARRQAEREKALKIFETVVNTAAGVAKALPNLLLAGLVAAMGALQVATIASAPLPELADGDWFRNGDKHSAASRGINVKIERDEAVMKADAMTNPGIYTVTGTTAQITSSLNGLKNGKQWAGGATFSSQMQWLQQQPKSINSSLPNIISQANKTDTAALENKLDNLVAAFEKFPREIKGKWVINDFKEANNKYDASLKAGSLKQ